MRQHCPHFAWVRGLVLGLMFLCMQGAAAQPVDTDALLAKVKAYRFGDERGSLVALEKGVGGSAADPQARQALAAKLAGLLANDVSVEARQLVCRLLGDIGSAAEVGELARLLTDPALSDSARLALERIGGNEAVGALRASLNTTSGAVRMGVIQSLGTLRSEAAVGELAALSSDTDLATAMAAIEALGRIGSDSAAKSLQSIGARIPERARQSWGDAMLRCAEQAIVRGESAKALTWLGQLTGAEQAPTVRQAAFQLRVRLGGKEAPEQVGRALSGADAVLRAAALRALRSSQDAGVLRGVAAQLADLPVDLQVAVVTLLGERRDLATAPALVKATGSTDAAVRSAAIVALGQAGDASAIGTLTGLASNANAEEATLIRTALTRLRGSQTDEALIAAINSATPAAQALLIRALVSRDCGKAVPAFIATLGQSKDAEVRRAASSAIEDLAGADSIAALLKLLDHSESAVRDTGISTLGAVARRTGQLKKLLESLPGASAQSRPLLLGAIATVGGPDALEAIRKELKSGDDATRLVIVRLLSNWPDAAPLDDLAALAMTTQDARVKALALRGVARLAPLAGDRQADQVVELLCKSLVVASPPEQKSLLAALAKFPTAASLKAALEQLKNAELAEEAGLAALNIIDKGESIKPDEAKSAMEAVRAACRSSAVTARLSSLTLRGEKLTNFSIGATATSPTGLAVDGQASGPRAAIDNNPKTYWDEADGQQLYVLRVKLKQRAPVALLRITAWAQHDHAARDFDVVCDDQVVAKVRDAKYVENKLTVDLPVTECTTVELRITGYYGKSPAIRELEILGKPSRQ